MIICDLCGVKGLKEEDLIQTQLVSGLFGYKPRDEFHVCCTCVAAVREVTNRIRQKYVSLEEQEVQEFLKDYTANCRGKADE